MSRKIGVCELGLFAPSTYVRKSVARRLVRRGWAIWVKADCMIRRLSERHIPEPEPIPIQAKPYIPDKLPPHELLGLKFEPPIGMPSQGIFLAKAARVFAENAAR